MRERQARPFGILALLAMLVAFTVPSSAVAQLGDSFTAMADNNLGSNGHVNEWDLVDVTIDLTGLWGSIEPEIDKDPVWAIRAGDGTVFLVWAKHNGARFELVYSFRPSGGSWSLVQAIENTPSTTFDDTAPSIVIDEADRLHVAWVRESPGAGGWGAIMHSVRVGGLWSTSLVISGPELAFDPVMRLEDGQTLVQYRTAMATVVVAITVYQSSGGSDEVDPGTNTGDDVTVETSVASYELHPR